MGLWGGSKFDKAFEEYEQPKENFWQGGEKFGARDAIGGLLAALGDGLTNHYGGQGTAVQGLMGGRLDAQKLARKRAEEQAQIQAAMATVRASNPNLTDPQALAIASKLGNYSDFKPPEPTEFERTMKGAGYDPNGPQVSELYRRKLSRDLADRQNLVMNPETGGMEWVTVPGANLPPPQQYDRVAGETVPIPTLQPTPEQALAELRRRRGY